MPRLGPLFVLAAWLLLTVANAGLAVAVAFSGAV